MARKKRKEEEQQMGPQPAPGISQVASSARKLKAPIKDVIASETGIQQEEINDENLKGAVEITQGAQKVAQRGINPDVVNPARLKEEVRGEPVKESPEDLTKQKLLAQALLGLTSTLIGAAAGGTEGGAIGAKAGQMGVQTFQETEAAAAEEKARKQKEAEAKETQDRLFALKEEANEVQRLESIDKREKAQLKLASDLRKERNALPTTRDTQKIVAAGERIRASGMEPTAAGDLALIFNYMKMLDPTSTVRESEFANAANAAGVGERLRAQYNRVFSGERLSEKQRADFLARAEQLLGAQLKVQKTVDDQFITIAEEAGVDPEDVLISFGVQTPEVEKAKEEAGVTSRLAEAAEQIPSGKEAVAGEPAFVADPKMLSDDELDEAIRRLEGAR